MQASVDARDRDYIFEELWLLRACYPHRSDYDTRATLTVGDAISYGEQLLRLMRLQQRRRRFGQTHHAA